LERGLLWTAVAGFLAVAVIGTVSGRVHVQKRPTGGSIVSLSPNATEIVFALGLGERLVGVSTACDYPPEAKHLRKAGDLGAPNIELIYALKPELVIGTMLRDPEMKKVVERCGARLLTIEQQRLDEIPDAILAVGEAAGVPDAARRRADALRARIARATVDVPDDERPRVFIELSGQPLRTAAEGTFVDDLIGRAGGRNIAHDLGPGWITVSPDTVVARDPEIIIVAHPIGLDGRYALGQRIGWNGISAVRSGRVVDDLDLSLILRPGPRVAEGLEALARLFAAYREARGK